MLGGQKVHPISGRERWGATTWPVVVRSNLDPRLGQLRSDRRVVKMLGALEEEDYYVKQWQEECSQALEKQCGQKANFQHQTLDQRNSWGM